MPRKASSLRVSGAMCSIRRVVVDVLALAREEQAVELEHGAALAELNVDVVTHEPAAEVDVTDAQLGIGRELHCEQRRMRLACAVLLQAVQIECGSRALPHLGDDVQPARAGARVDDLLDQRDPRAVADLEHDPRLCRELLSVRADVDDVHGVQ